MPDSSIPINAPTTVGQSVAAFLDASGDEHEKTIAEFIDGGGQPVKVSTADPLPVTDADALAALLSIAGEDFATQTTLAAILTKLNASIAVTGTFFQATQPVSAAALPLPSGAATSALQQNDALTNTQLRLTPVPISGTVTVTGGGDALASNQTLQITQETAINTVLGLVADAIVAAGATGSISAKLRRATQGLEDLKTAIVLAAGANIIGKVGIDQTTPGTTNGVQVNNTVTTSEAAPTTVFNGKTTVTTAGTRVVLAASQAVKSVSIKALSTNTGLIYVGNATVSSTNGFQLAAGDSVNLDISNLNTINIDSAVSAEGVSYLGVN